MRGLTRRVKFALVSAVLLSAAIYAPIAIALKVHHTGPGRQGEHKTEVGAHRQSPHPNSSAPAVAFAHESIIGGGSAQDGTFPSLAYVVDVEGKYVYQCTGTVVAPTLILTAGHCAENMKTGVVNKPSGYRVVTGTVDPMLPEPTVSTVLGVIVYPGLARRVDDGDAALLVLSTPVTAPAVALATTSETSHIRAGLPAVIAGWGLTSYEQRLPTEVLQSAATVVQARKWCTLNAPPFYAKSELCTIAAPSYATGVCAGDSGGPLLVQRPTGGEPVQIGIAVHVYGRCSTRHPSVFASIGSISSWIHTWIEAYKRPPASPEPSPPPTPSPVPPPVPSPPVPSTFSSSTPSS
ncbi:MAG: serine protease [Solirubrobacteraceae bacterium]